MIIMNKIDIIVGRVVGGCGVRACLQCLAPQYIIHTHTRTHTNLSVVVRRPGVVHAEVPLHEVGLEEAHGGHGDVERDGNEVPAEQEEVGELHDPAAGALICVCGMGVYCWFVFLGVFWGGGIFLFGVGVLLSGRTARTSGRRHFDSGCWVCGLILMIY